MTDLLTMLTPPGAALLIVSVVSVVVPYAVAWWSR